MLINNIFKNNFQTLLINVADAKKTKKQLTKHTNKNYFIIILSKDQESCGKLRRRNKCLSEKICI